MRWFNHHLREAAHRKRMVNFGSSLQDCDALSTVLQVHAGRNCIGHGYMGHNYTGRDYIRP